MGVGALNPPMHFSLRPEVEADGAFRLALFRASRGPGWDGVALPAHASNPQSLLALARALYGKAPPAWLVTVAGTDFGLSETLSPAGQHHAREARVCVDRLIWSLSGDGDIPCTSSA